MAERSSAPELTEDQRRVLSAVVEGYRARAGMKDRLRALNEWEIARRSGSTSLSYAEYMGDPTRDDLIVVLSELERLGFVSAWHRGGGYDTFVPTDRGGSRFDAPEKNASTEIDGSQNLPTTASDPVLERLDEIIRLLQSIDSRLPR